MNAPARVALLIAALSFLSSCKPAVECGPGTTEQEGRCVPDETLTCGAGTEEVGGACVPSDPLQCGPGTSADAGQCVPDAACGPGTVLVGGECVPQEELDCGPGTTQSGNECVPDGSVICGDGTRFDSATGTCVSDPEACGAGTVFVDGRCVTPDSTLVADATEAPEPNENLAGTIPLPAVGGPGFVIHGCIVPTVPPQGGDHVSDLDVWRLHTDAPALLEITADGVGGLAAGFVVVGDGVDRFERFGLNLTGDLSRRQIFLPQAGDYALILSDSRTLIINGASGGPGACYFTTVRRLAIPEPTPIEDGVAATGTLGSEVRFYRLPSVPDAALISGALSVPSESALAGVMIVRNGLLHSNADEREANSTHTSVVSGAIRSSDAHLLVVDTLWNYAIAPVPFEFVARIRPSAPIVSGVTVTGTATGATPTNPLGGHSFSHFEVTTPDSMVRVNVEGTAGFYSLVDHDGRPRGSITVGASDEGWWRLDPGLYYVVRVDSSGNGTPFSFSPAFLPVTPPVATVGGGLSSPVTVEDGQSAWFWLERSAQPWIGVTVASSDTTVSELSMEVATVLPGTAYTPLAPRRTTVLIEPGQWDFGFIPASRPESRFLVRLLPSGWGATTELRITPAPRGEDLGRLVDDQPGSRSVELPAAGRAFVFLQGPPGAQVSLTATPPSGSDLTLRRLNQVEASAGLFNSAGIDGPETVPWAPLLSTDFLALELTSVNGVGGTVALNFVADVPPLYEVSTGDAAFIDVCSDAAAVSVFTGQDERMSTAITLPWSFPLYETPAATMRISTNGFINLSNTTSPAPQNVALPNLGVPQGAIAPFWDDLDDVDLCYLMKTSADPVVVQWTGRRFEAPTEPVQFQAILHGDGRIDFLYGPNHLAASSSATVGLETVSGAFGQTLSFNQADATPAGSSIHLVPGTD